MSEEKNIPVLVGVGQVLQRSEDPREAEEPLALMATALERAEQDAGGAKLLARADEIHVLRGVWGYSDPARALAQRFGAAAAETVGTPYGGNYAQGCVIDAAREIQAGRRQVVLVAGAENGRSLGQAIRLGIRLSETETPGLPDRLVDDPKAIFHDAEIARGMNSASDMYAIFESAIRFAKGESLDDHAKRIAELWAGFSEVAQGNPHAWIRKAYSAEEIRRAGPENPMISSPYTRLMNANARVDMAAGILVCSLAIAREVGVPEERIVYPHAASEANDPIFPSIRHELHRSPAMRLAGGKALELAGKAIEEVDHIDLYSCFPSAVQIAVTELGIPGGRPLSVTGGLTFGGGPLNSYTLHSIARMVEVLREDRGSVGLVTGNGGWLAKHAFGVYSSEPPTAGFLYENVQAEVDALPTVEAVVDFEGLVTIEAYTVAHKGGVPRVGQAACRTDDGRRTWGLVSDPAVMEAMTREEFCGRRGQLDGKGGLQID